MDLRHVICLLALSLMVGGCPKSSSNDDNAGSPWDTSVAGEDPDDSEENSSDNAAENSSENAQTDTGDDEDTSDSAPEPESCDEGAFPLNPESCNPTKTGECPDNGYCSFAIVGSPPPVLQCIPREREGAGGDGADCTSSLDCQEGFTCIDWSDEPDPRGRVCTRFCELESGNGCPDGEFCTRARRLPPAEGIGVCTPRCDPYDANACGAGQTCSIDYNYPDETCAASFRCVEIAAGGEEGAACGENSAVARCTTGLTCYETENDLYRCVTPCESDADCEGTCGDPTGPWALRYCSL